MLAYGLQFNCLFILHSHMCRMDRSSACRVVIQVPAYVEQPGEEYHITSNNRIIIDKDTTNWIDFSAELDAMVKHGEQQELHVSFLDKACNEYVRITSDAVLLEAFSQYWDIRRLSLQVIVHDLEPLEEVLPSTNLETALVCCLC